MYKTFAQFREDLQHADRQRLDALLASPLVTSAELRRAVITETRGAYKPARSTISLYRADRRLNYATAAGGQL